MSTLSKILMNKEGFSNEHMFYVNKWHEWLREDNEKHNIERAKTGHYYHASGLVEKYFCLVKAVLEDMLPEKQDVNSMDTLAIYKEGNVIHAKHQGFLKEKFDTIYIEKPLFSDFLQLTATPDAIIKFLGKPTIVEIKSMNCFTYDKTKEPPLNAYAQAQIYMYMYGIYNALVVCENKNNQQIKIFPIEFNLKECLRYIVRVRAMIICKKKNKVPLSKRYCKTPKQKAKQCKFNSLCWDEKAIEKMLAGRVQ